MNGLEVWLANIVSICSPVLLFSFVFSWQLLTWTSTQMFKTYLICSIILIKIPGLQSTGDCTFVLDNIDDGCIVDYDFVGLVSLISSIVCFCFILERFLLLPCHYESFVKKCCTEVSAFYPFAWSYLSGTNRFTV